MALALAAAMLAAPAAARADARAGGHALEARIASRSINKIENWQLERAEAMVSQPRLDWVRGRQLSEAGLRTVVFAGFRVQRAYEKEGWVWWWPWYTKMYTTAEQVYVYRYFGAHRMLVRLTGDGTGVGIDRKYTRNQREDFLAEAGVPQGAGGRAVFPGRFPWDPAVNPRVGEPTPGVPPGGRPLFDYEEIPLTRLEEIMCAADLVVARKISPPENCARALLYIPLESEQRPRGRNASLTLRPEEQLKPSSDFIIEMASLTAHRSKANSRVIVYPGRIGFPNDPKGQIEFFQRLDAAIAREYEWHLVGFQNPHDTTDEAGRLRALLDSRNITYHMPEVALGPAQYYALLGRARLVTFYGPTDWNPRVSFEALYSNTPFLASVESKVPFKLYSMGWVGGFNDDFNVGLREMLATDFGDLPIRYAQKHVTARQVFDRVMSSMASLVRGNERDVEWRLFEDD